VFLFIFSLAMCIVFVLLVYFKCMVTFVLLLLVAYPMSFQHCDGMCALYVHIVIKRRLFI